LEPAQPSSFQLTAFSLQEGYLTILVASEEQESEVRRQNTKGRPKAEGRKQKAESRRLKDEG
jgi:hypothetical protein